MSFIIVLIILCLFFPDFFNGIVTAAVFIFVFTILFLILMHRSGSNKTRETKPFDTSSSTYTSNPKMKNNAYTKFNAQFSTYNVHHRNKDGFCDNMNYRIYQCKGLYVQTKRKRSIKIEAFSESDVEEQLKQAGFIEPFEIERIAFPPVTDAQKNALGSIYLGDVCQYDASAILSKKYDNDSTPNPQLISYAEECKIKFSYYIGKKNYMI